jgi:putative ABC transport system permease protein
MFAYYLELALISLKRNKALTALMVVAVALGIGACMTTLSVLHAVSGDPLPQRGLTIFHPEVDAEPADGYAPGDQPDAQLTWIDGMNLLKDRRGDRQALMTGGRVPLEPDNASMESFFADARYTTADFFPMFGMSFMYGRPWIAADDEARARVVVISDVLNEKIFGGADSTGRMLRVNDADLRVVGVMHEWKPSPHFYDLNAGDFAASEQVFVPLTTSRDLKLARAGSTNCWGKESSSEDTIETAGCSWLQYWVELDSPAKVAAYREYLVHYSREQKARGRFEREPNVALYNVGQWLDHNNVVPGDVKLQAWLAAGFLVVCLVNTVGLMLAKFMRRSSEVSIRRALGASRSAVLAQLLTEAGMIGLAGGVGGLLLALLGLWMVRMQPEDYAALARLDMPMLGVTFLMAVGSTLLAGLLPAWRACQIAPALQLKSQ